MFGLGLIRIVVKLDDSTHDGGRVGGEAMLKNDESLFDFLRQKARGTLFGILLL